MKFENKIFDEEEYTLVEVYENEKYGNIYHFAGDNSDVFCTKENEKYKRITDENIIDEILEEYDLKNSDIYFSNIIINQILHPSGVTKLKQITDEVKDKIIEEQIEVLSKLNCEIDEHTFRKILQRVKFQSAKILSTIFEAYYDSKLNEIVYDEKDITSDAISSKRVRLHESIHGLTGKDGCAKVFARMDGLLEGATENIVEKIYGNKTSSVSGSLRFNFSQEATYEFQVALIRQMEYALGKECDEGILYRNSDFFSEFANKYGKDAFRTISHRANRLLPQKNLKDSIKYFKKTQDIMLKIIFDKEFEKIDTIDDAIAYLKKLQGFETTRAKPVRGQDKIFIDYYNEKLQQAKDKLIKLGSDPGFIENVLNQYQYEQLNFKPYPEDPSYEEFVERDTKKFVLTALASIIKKKESIEEKSREFKLYKGICGESGEYTTYLLLTRNGEPTILRLIDQDISVIAKTDSEKKKHDSYTHRLIGGNFSEDVDLQIHKEDGKFIITDGTLNTILEEEPLTKTNHQSFIQEIHSIQSKRVGRVAAERAAMRRIAGTQTLSQVNAMVDKVKSFFTYQCISTDVEKDEER